MLREQKAVVAMSGGQDSTTCLAWAIDKYGAENVHAVTFDYGQRHRVEMYAAMTICRKWRIPQMVLSVPAFEQLGAAALTNESIDVNVDAAGTGNDYAEAAGLPSTFVPGRNLIFLGLVAAFAVQHGIGNIVTGVCYSDEAGYPDCRPEFIETFEQVARVAMGNDDLTIHAPLLYLSKGATFSMAEALGVLSTIIVETHTCYNGVRDALHPWGWGCGTCGACIERADGFAEFKNRVVAS